MASFVATMPNLKMIRPGTLKWACETHRKNFGFNYHLFWIPCTPEEYEKRLNEQEVAAIMQS